MSTSRATAARARTVPTLLDEAATRVPTRRAVSDEHASVDYLTLHTRVATAAAALRAAGLGRGDRVAIMVPNSIAFVEGFLAVLACGAAALPVSIAMRGNELRRLQASAGFGAVISEDGALDVDVGLQLACDGTGLRVTHEAAGHPRHAAVTAPAASDAALVAASSGTVARPHLVTRTHENLWWEAENFGTATGLGPDDVVLGVVPLSHAHGLGNAFLASLRAGAHLVLRPRFLRRQTLDLLAAEHVTLFPCVPFMLRMLAATDRRRRWDLSALRLCLSAGAPLPSEVFHEFRDRFGVRARQLYGLTEAGSVSCDLAGLDRIDAASVERMDPASVGRPLGTAVITIEDTAGRALPAGEVGEIVIRSPAAEGGAAHPLRTRDLGRLDSDGALTVTGRTSLFINAAGNKIDPAEVEAALRTHPAVADVAVFALAVAHDDQVVAAAVVLATPVGADALRAHCRGLLAPYKVPRVITFRAALPRSPLGKVLIGRLQEEAQT